MKKTINKILLLTVLTFTIITYWSCNEDPATNNTIIKDKIDKDTINKDTLIDDNTIRLSKEEKELYDLMMSYRAELDLDPIPLSVSLTVVAQTHSKDLFENKPVTSECNMHSWSDKGEWTSCCYTSDHAQAACMWNKPRELTNYTGNGYEIAAGSTASNITPQNALNLWKGSPGHNNVITNSGSWTKEWKAIGFGMVGGYATVWFGREEDPDGAPKF
jgi:uncharacterized protein YkwD